MTPRLYTINGWVLAAFALAQGALLIVLLSMLGDAQERLAGMQGRSLVDRARAEECSRTVRYCEALTAEQRDTEHAYRARLIALEKECGEW